ncbi:Biopolymer transport protein ExbD [Planctomycetales bacterium 10988]|nr:Biopolymer transport protein ExbD [Planctomycetales bacterium 10988]
MAVKLPKSTALESLSITPLIDVVFLLLIFFLVATRFEEEERELSVVLPQASEARPLTETPEELIVNINKQGEFIVGGEVRSSEELFADLKQAWANNPGQQTVLIRADESSPLRYAAEVMNLCNRANILDYRLATHFEE